MARIKENVPYLFIHPSWRAAWCWERVLQIMQAWGREAYALDLPGHGSRYHEIERVRLADYPRAVAEFIQEHDLDCVVLVGNSMGGLVIQLTAQEIPERISHLIWYMGFILKDGESVRDVRPPEVEGGFFTASEGNKIPVPPHAIIREKWMQDMTGEEQTADLQRWQPQPLAPSIEKADLKRFYSDPRVQEIPKSFINGVKDVCYEWEYRKAWDPRLSGNITNFTYAEVPGSHCCFNCHPEELVQAVIELAEYEHRGEMYAKERLKRRLLYKVQ
ncbi:MAG: alpha/beta hydrolase [Candidatus Tectomicrobia bacterium]|nr:alpha/beta hydrolase [Candidatus Tectomicrobia bacterium]